MFIFGHSQKKAVQVFRNKLFKKNSSKKVDNDELKYLLDNALDIMGVTYLKNNYQDYLMNPNVINYLYEIIWSYFLSSPQRLTLFNMNYMYKIYVSENNGVKVTGRLLGSSGIYPDVLLKKAGNMFIPYHGFPLLITKNKKYEEKYSEVIFMNREELKFAISVLIAKVNSLYHFYFQDFGVIEFDFDISEEIKEYDLAPFFFEMILLKLKFSNKSSTINTTLNLNDQFEFSNFKDNIDSFYRVFNNYDIDNQLLLRTSFYLVKSIMLWSNRSFGEDSIANSLFAIEGCFLLIQKKLGYSSEKIDLDIIRKFFIEKFRNGKQLFNFIRAGYNKRTTIVHPVPSWGTEWAPNFYADDFYDYFNMAKKLLYYYLTDTLIEGDLF